MKFNRRDFPDDWRELARIQVSLPPVQGEDESSCPVSQADVIEYLGWEAPGGEHAGHEKIVPFSLRFLRTGLVNGDCYWIWSFSDADDTESYVFVRRMTDGNVRMAYDESFGLTPEQFIIMEHFDL